MSGELVLPMTRIYVIESWWYYVRWALRELVHGRDIRWALGILWRSTPRIYRTEYAFELSVGPLAIYVQRKPMPVIRMPQREVGDER